MARARRKLGKRARQTTTRKFSGGIAKKVSSQLLLDHLEKRVMLSGNLAVDEWTAIGANTDALFGVDANTTAGVTVDYVADANSVDSITINLPAGTDFQVGLFYSGTATSNPAITVTGMDAGDNVVVNMFIEQVDDDTAADGGINDIIGATSGFTASTFDQDSAGGDPTGDGAEDGASYGPTGDVGDLTIPAEWAGGNNTLPNTWSDLLLANTGTGSTGTIILLNGADLNGNATTDNWSDGSSGGVEVNGNVTLNAQSWDIEVSGSNQPTIDVGIGGTIFVNSTESLRIDADDDGTGLGDRDLGTVTLGAVDISGTGDVLIGANGDNNSVSGLTVNGPVTISNTGNLRFTSEPGSNDDIGGTVDFNGLVTLNDTNGGGGSVIIEPDGTGDLNGSVRFDGGVNISGANGAGIVNVGTPNSALNGSLVFGPVVNNNTAGAGIDVDVDSIGGDITFGTVDLGTAAGVQSGGVDVLVVNNVSGTTSFDDIVIGSAGDGDTGGLSIAAGGDLQNVNFQDVTMNSTNVAASVNIAAADIDDVFVASTWNFNGAGAVNITASNGNTGVFGNLGGANWDINFNNTAATVALINFVSDDGAGTFTVNTIDHVGATNVGGITLNLNNDSPVPNPDGIAPIGAFQIRNAGDDTSNNISWGDNSVVSAEQGPSITIAGGVTGAFVAGQGTGDDDGWGPVIIGQDFSGAAVPNSDFLGTLFANDGISSITVQGNGSSLGSAVSPVIIQANADGAFEDSTLGAGFLPVGSLGPVTIAGEQDLSQLEGFYGVVIALDMSTFELTNGVWGAGLQSLVPGTVADRQAMTSDVGTIQVGVGGSAAYIAGGTILADDGVGAITVQSTTPYFGDVFMTGIITDFDGFLGGAAIGGGFGGLTATGEVQLGTLQTDGVGDNVDRASQDSGTIQAGQHITIGLLDIGGDIPSVTIQYTYDQTLDDGTAVGSPPVPADTTPDITITTLDVNGDLDTVATNGDANEDILIGVGGFGIIRGDLDEINAGEGEVQLNALQVVGGTTSTPVYIITDLGVDYILAVSGTFTGGVINSTVTFPPDVPTIGVREENDDPTIAINDIDGTTSWADTELAVVTRQAGTPYTDGDDANEEWDVTTLQDPDNDQHDFHLIRIEGDLIGPIGADNDLFDGDPGDTDPFRSLGNIDHIEIKGTWDNANFSIFALSLDEISFGSTTATPVTTDVADNTNGTAEDLELYTAFAPITGTDVAVPIPDGGSITKLFVGPTGGLESITFTDTDLDGVVNTVVLDIDAGMLRDIHLFGENIGIEYQAADPENPATDGNTHIFYGVAQGGLAATEVTEIGDLAIDFMDWSSTIGNVTTTDIDPADAMGAGVGNVTVGYFVTVDNAADQGPIRDWINDPNNGLGASGSLLQVDSAGNVIFAGTGNFLIEGWLDTIASSGDVGDITTVDTMPLIEVTNPNYPYGGDRGPVDGIATFGGLVTDGAAGTITVAGNAGPLVIGDQVVVDTGTDLVISPGAVGGAADTIGINGTPTFGGPINVTGNLGYEALTIGAVTTASPTDDVEVPTITGDEVSAPDGIGVPITVGGALNSAIVAGKRIIVDDTANQEDDDITGAILADNIFGDIWAGDDISATITSNGAIAGGVTWMQIAVGANVPFGPFSRIAVATPAEVGTYTITITDPDMDMLLLNDTIGVEEAADTEPNFIENPLTADGVLNTRWELSQGQVVFTSDDTLVITGQLAVGDLDVFQIPVLNQGGGDLKVAFSGSGAQNLAVYDSQGILGIPPLGPIAGGSVDVNAGAGGFSNVDNPTIDIVATGGSPGDITGDITANDDIVDFTVDAGSGQGGSILADIIAGLDGTGAIVDTGTNNIITADNNVGADAGGHVISAADSIDLEVVSAGLQTDLVAFGGNLNSDISAGIPLGAAAPVSGNINESNIPLYENENDSISIALLSAGTVDGPDQDGVPLNDMNSNLWSTLTAAGSISIDGMAIDGNAVGNDGVAGGHIAAAGLGYKDATFGTPNSLFIGGGAVIADVLGTFSAGLFVPTNGLGASPLNPNDGDVERGTVLTLGAVDIALDMGRWIQSDTGSNNVDGINLGELLVESELGASDTFFAPFFSVGATHDMDLNIWVVGRPYAAPQTGPGNDPPNAADGDAVDVSIAAFGEVDGLVQISDSGDINFVMANVDAVIARDSDSDTPTNPSNPTAGWRLNAGDGGSLMGEDNELLITSLGNGEGGLDVEYFLAGYDYFAQVNGAAFPDAFGLGEIEDGGLIALDDYPEDGLEVADLSFALIAAGEDIDGDFVAQDDIIARLGSASTDGAIALPGGLDADMIAGLSADPTVNPIGGSTLFPGGDFEAIIVAGDDIYSMSNAENLMTLAVQKGPNDAGASGDFEDDFVLVSGAEDQFNDGVDVSGDINAVLIAADDFLGLIDAGDTQSAWGAVTGGGLFGAAGQPAGSFRGGVHAGAGVDLDIFTTADNEPDGDIGEGGDGIIRTSNDLDVSNLGDVQLGLLAEDDIKAPITVGWGIDGGNLLGDIVCEDDIAEIQIWGNLGAVGADSVLMAGGGIGVLGVGNPSGLPGPDLRDPLLYIDSFGTVYSDIYLGGLGDSDADIYIGGSLAAGVNLVIGIEEGVDNVVLQQNGYETEYDTDESMIIVQQGPAVDTPGPNVYLYGDDADLDVTGDGQPAGINRLVAVDDVDELHVVDGSVRQIIVNDDYTDLTTELDNAEAPFNLDLWPFLQNSLPIVREIEHAVNDDKDPTDIDEINVEHNIGIEGVSIGEGFLCDFSNAAIWVQGTITDYADSVTGSIGNIYIGGTDLDGDELDVVGLDGDIHAGVSIGDIYVEAGSLTDNIFEDREIIAVTGSIGVINVQEDLNVNIDTDAGGNPEVVVQADEDLGGLISRNGHVQADVHVHGDPNAVPGEAHGIGLIQASGDIWGSYVAETGSVGIDLDEGDCWMPINGAEIYSHVGNIGGYAEYLEEVDGFDIPAITLGGLFGVTGDIHVPSILFIDQTLDIVAGENVGDIEAHVGTVGLVYDADLLEISTDLPLLFDIAFDRVYTGELLTTVDPVVTITAGDGIGNITAGASIGFDALGYEGGNPPVDPFLNPHDEFRMPEAMVVARAERASIGNLQALSGNIDVVAEARVDIGAVAASENITGIYRAETGSIGDALMPGGDLMSFMSDAGDVEVEAVAGLNMEIIRAPLGGVDSDVIVGGDFGTDITYNGNALNISVMAGGDIMGSYTSTDGSIGGLITTAGNIGSDEDPTVVTSNGGVDIDLETLEYVQRNPGDRGGVGVIFSEIGDIDVVVTTGGNLGVPNTPPADPDNIIGGIAAPNGTVQAQLEVGGNVGGLSGTDVSVEGPVVGAIGRIINPEPNSSATITIDPANPFLLITDTVTYTTAITDGSATVTYTVDGDGDVTFTNVLFDPDESNAVDDELSLTTNTDVLADVEAVLVEGEADSLIIEGNVETITTTGDLGGEAGDPGVVTIEGTVGSIAVEGDITYVTISAGTGLADPPLDQVVLGSVFASGDIGVAADATNPFVPEDVDIVAPSIGVIDAAGTNFGMVNVTLEGRSWISWENPQSDELITAFLQAGEAELTVNFGYLQNVAFTGRGNPVNFVVMSAPDDPDADFDDPTDTLTTDVLDDPMAYRELALQWVMVQRGLRSIGPDFENWILENGTASELNSDTANVGSIVMPGNADIITRMVIEGSVQEIDAGMLRHATIVGDAGDVDLTGSAIMVDVLGDLGSLNAERVIRLNVEGDAGHLSAQDFISVDIAESVRTMSASNRIVRADIGGGAGFVSAGSMVNQLSVDDGMVSLTSEHLRNVSVGGGIGLIVDADGSPVFNPSGLDNLPGLVGGNPADSGDAGPTEGLSYIGGLEAETIARVSVTGQIVDLQIHRSAVLGGLDVVSQVIDDALVRLNKRDVLIIEDGEPIDWEGV